MHENFLKPLKEFCSLKAPYEVTSKTEEHFITAMRINLFWHQEKSRFFKNLLQQRGFDPHSLTKLEDLDKIPFLLANFFKKHVVLSIEEKDVYLHLTSSGTTGQKSQVFFDQWSLSSAQGMVSSIFDYYGWNTPEEKVNYLLYSYGPRIGSKLGTAYTDQYLCQYAKINDLFYALRNVGNDKHQFDIFGCLRSLEKFAEEGLPVRIFGFPSFLYFTLKKMRELGMPPLSLHKKSLVFLGGGWKGFADQSISKEELYSMINECLGIPDDRLRDGFGSVEHCVPYVECSAHQFHVPVWSKVIIRDVKNLRPLAFGEKGFLQFISPYITSMPLMSVLMGDLASLHDGKNCPCEIETPYFIVYGRAGISKNKSCAVSAAELLRNEQ